MNVVCATVPVASIGRQAASTVTGGFLIKRVATDRTALRAAGDVLALGEPLVMFPEGTRNGNPASEGCDLRCK